MMKYTFFFALLLISCLTQAQSNVRAWYAQGQVWVVWEIGPLPIPETVGIYKKNSPFTNITQANLIGRPYQYEYLPGTFIAQTSNPGFTYRIPKPDGSLYQLAPGEGLFVETVLNTGASYYAVVNWGQTTVVAGQNLTANAVNYTYSPQMQPVNCHLQLAYILPSGHQTAWFAMWALGRQDENAGRPDFPVMANAAKNGMPSMFIVSQSLTLDTSGGKKVPMTHWLHGGGMYANQFLPNNFKAFNIEPKEGISVSHNDDFPVKTISDGDSVFTAGRSLWFGWTKSHNPFDHHFTAQAGDTVINYTQRRVVWINDWLIKHFPIDSNRVALQGYSMGSGGVTGLAKAFPNKFSTACLFNCGLRGAVDDASIRIVGSIADNLPTNLRGYNNETMHINHVFDLNSRLSESRDFPIIRLWVGKNDPNDRMHWGPDLVAQLRMADSLGWGTQIHWDERMHVYSTLGMHWIEDLTPISQTYRDNLAYQESFNSKQSYPAFFNHHLDVQNNDPGVGQWGINNGDGDNWGAWGGWHNWDQPIDTENQWSVEAWLESDAVFANDNCPVNALDADLAVRKPQLFKPAVGKILSWTVKDESTGNLLQSGTTTVGAEGLVVVPQVRVFRKDTRKVVIRVFEPNVSNSEPLNKNLSIYPNPVSQQLQLPENAGRTRVFDLGGKLWLETEAAAALDVRSLPKGLYLLQTDLGWGKFVKQ